MYKIHIKKGKENILFIFNYKKKKISKQYCDRAPTTQCSYSR